MQTLENLRRKYQKNSVELLKCNHFLYIQPDKFLDKRVLVAALNWGLGHATRCIPLIHEVQRAGAEVTLASDGRALELWRQEFPDLPFLEMPAYGIRYPSHWMMWNMFWQAPKIQLAIWRERHWLDQQVRKTPFDIILSDNRFGCYHPETRNIFLTHQLNIQTPWSWTARFVNVLNHRMIARFDECWVPDWAGEENLSGILSHGKLVEQANLPPLTYLGPLSRFIDHKPESRFDEKSTPGKQLPDKMIPGKHPYDAIAILSGPEPQRTYLERELLDQLNDLPGCFLIIQGKTEKKQRSFAGKVEVVSFMTSEQLSQVMVKSRVVICRSGYSSLMDLVGLEKKAILIPTPGQTEQEYLARHLSGRKNFVVMKQGKVDIAEGMNRLRENE